MDLQKHLKLRGMNGSLYLTVPKDFIKAHDLRLHGDVYWVPEIDGIKLKFLDIPTLNPYPTQFPVVNNQPG